MNVFCTIDNKHIPLARILWIAELPHYCGSEECEREGTYQLQLEQGEVVWATRAERDAALEALRQWLSHGRGPASGP